MANVVNYFRENGFTVEMDAMNSNERVDLGPTRWAEQQIKNARNVFVFLSPELRRLCASDVEGAEFSQQVLCKDQSDITPIQSDVTFACLLLNNMRSCYKGTTFF